MSEYKDIGEHKDLEDFLIKLSSDSLTAIHSLSAKMLDKTSEERNNKIFLGNKSLIETTLYDICEKHGVKVKNIFFENYYDPETGCLRHDWREIYVITEEIPESTNLVKYYLSTHYPIYENFDDWFIDNKGLLSNQYYYLNLRTESEYNKEQHGTAFDILDD